MTDEPEIRVDGGSGNDSYRTCAQCGADCLPEPIESNHRSRIVFLCPEHRLHSIVDPFEEKR
jgi:hypothetical protein